MNVSKTICTMSKHLNPAAVLICSLTAVLAAAPAASVAEPAQIGFSITAQRAQDLFRYRIRDRQGREGKIKFALPTAAIAASAERFRAYQPSELRDLADADRQRRTAKLLDSLRQRYPRVEFSTEASGGLGWRIGPPVDFQGAQRRIFEDSMARRIIALRDRWPDAEIRFDSGGYQISAPDDRQLRAIEQGLRQAQDAANAAIAAYADRTRKGMQTDAAEIRSQVGAEVDAIAAAMDDFARTFFRERYYRLKDARQLLPDFARIAQAEAPDLAPLATAIAAWSAALDGPGAGQRSLLNRLLLFTQTIPYDALKDRAASAGFLAPLQLLQQNRGDCDSKSVLFAAIAHQLYPKLPIALVLLSNHAYIALGLAPQPGDTSLDSGGRRWTLAEPVGPGNSRIGELAPDSRGIPVETLLPLFD